MAALVIFNNLTIQPFNNISHLQIGEFFKLPAIFARVNAEAS